MSETPIFDAVSAEHGYEMRDGRLVRTEPKDPEWVLPECGGNWDLAVRREPEPEPVKPPRASRVFRVR